jgi:putative chitinase
MTIAERRAALLARVKTYGGPLNEPAVMAQFMAQVMHESGGLRYVREIWGPTAAQRRYEGRADLGNTQAGDGKRFMGRDVLQITGRANYRALTAWVHKTFGAKVDFEARPELLESPEWLGIGAIWYFLTRKDLIRYCREGNIEMVTRRVNGGLNGYQDRLRWYDDGALKLLGFTTVAAFQKSAGLAVDGISGPKTRAALHKALTGLKVAPKAAPEHDQERIKKPAPPAPEMVASDDENRAPKMLGTVILGAGAVYAAAAAWFNDTLSAVADWLIFWN